MPYCSNCGVQTREGARFCDSCGTPLAQATPGSAPQPAMALPPTESAADAGSAKMLLFGGLGLYAVAAALTLMAMNMLGFTVSLVVIGVLYGYAYMPLTKGQNKEAKIGAAISAGISLVLAIINLFMGAPAAAIFNAIAAAALGFAWKQIK